MSHLTVKSTFNFDSATILHKEKHYCSAVHCAYYSSIQLMLHILMYKIGKTEEQAEKDAPTNVRGSHEILIHELNTYLKAVNKREVAAFNTNIVQMKRLRKKSDYKDEEIVFNDSHNTLTGATNVNQILRKAI